MSTRLDALDLGPVSLLAPDEPPRQVHGSHGRMWQWTGGGQELFTMVVAVRETRLGTTRGVRDHLAWEITQLQPDPPDGADAVTVEHVEVVVEGASAAAAADVVGRVAGHDVRHRLVVSSDGRLMHALRLVVPDDETGLGLARRVSRSLRVRPETA